MLPHLTASGTNRMDVPYNSVLHDTAHAKWIYLLPESTTNYRNALARGHATHLHREPMSSSQTVRKGKDIATSLPLRCMQKILTKNRVPSQWQCHACTFRLGFQCCWKLWWTSITSALSQGLIKRPTQSGESTSGSRKLSHLRNIRDNMLMAKGVSEKGAELLLVGQRKGTNTANQSGWARQNHWCSEQEVDPVSCGNQRFLDFLNICMEKVYSIDP